jgi:hypothetical protein
MAVKQCMVLLLGDSDNKNNASTRIALFYNYTEVKFLKYLMETKIFPRFEFNISPMPRLQYHINT